MWWLKTEILFGGVRVLLSQPITWVLILGKLYSRVRNEASQSMSCGVLLYELFWGDLCYKY